ncbi:MAG: single-stranded-DNA-specific exonuclease RecJ [Anaerolineae bacterium]
MLNRIRRWRIAGPTPAQFLSRFSDLDPLIAQVLYNRMPDPDEAGAFLEGFSDLDDPFRLRDMSQAVTRLREAIRAGEPIAVYGDFDADGVTATALLVLTLRSLGAEVHPYIPHRVDEGYGLNPEALTELAEKGVRVVVTVDCGVRSVAEVNHARRAGMDVIITDHHTLGDRLPNAIAVIDPRRAGSPYPYTHLAGVGLAYKLAQALLRSNGRVPIQEEPLIEEEHLLGLVALGTVADLAPLTGENRYLVRRGLEHLNTAPRPGMAALMRQAGVQPGAVDEDTIGYSLAPRLNAAGRVGHAKVAYQLLVAEYPAEAEWLARRLDQMNRRRQELTAEAMDKARQIVGTQGVDAPLLFVAAPELPAGVVGLVASRLLEAYYRPAVVVEVGEETSRGSARSVPEFHVTEALESCADLLVRYGGHREAAGFTVRTEDLPKLRRHLLDRATEALDGQELIPTLEADASVPLQAMSWDLWEGLQRLRPFGTANPEPLFVSEDVSVRHHRVVGTDGAHLKLYLFDGEMVWDGIAFRQGEWSNKLTDRIDIAYHLQLNEWRGERNLQLNIQDIRPSVSGEVFR